MLVVINITEANNTAWLPAFWRLAAITAQVDCVYPVCPPTHTQCTAHWATNELCVHVQSCWLFQLDQTAHWATGLSSAADVRRQRGQFVCCWHCKHTHTHTLQLHTKCCQFWTQTFPLQPVPTLPFDLICSNCTFSTVCMILLIVFLFDNIHLISSVNKNGFNFFASKAPLDQDIWYDCDPKHQTLTNYFFITIFSRLHLWHLSAGRHLRVLLPHRVQGHRLYAGHWRVPGLGVALRTWRHLRQHARLLQVRLCAGLCRHPLWDQHQRVRLQSLPEWRHLPGWTWLLSMRLHAW